MELKSVMEIELEIVMEIKLEIYCGNGVGNCYGHGVKLSRKSVCFLLDSVNLRRKSRLK